MSMTREEATKYAESKKMMLESLIYNDDCKYGNYAMYSAELSFINAALTALRPVSREQVMTQAFNQLTMAEGIGAVAKWEVRQYLTDEDEPTARAAVEQIAEETGADLMIEANRE